MNQPKAYTTDLRTLSDSELASLSLEIEEAYRHSCGDDDYWTDDEAETRFYEMQAEIRRRWEERNPEEAERRRNQPLSVIVQEALRAMRQSFSVAKAISREFDSQFAPKIGGTIHVTRRPFRVWVE